MAGTGSWTLSGLNTYTGVTSINAGTLNLNYTTNATNVVSSSSGLVLGGGTLNITPNTSSNTSQTFASVGLAAGTSSALVVNSSGTHSTTVSLGQIAQSNGAAPGGATLNFTLPTNGSITTTTANYYGNPYPSSDTILGRGMTVGGTTWAVSGTGATAGTITGLPTASYNTNISTPPSYGLDMDVPTGANNTINGQWYNSLRFNNAGSYTLTTTSGFGIASGGILETANVGNNPVTFTGGTGMTTYGTGVTAGVGTDMDFIQNNTQGIMAVDNIIYYQYGVFNVVKAGPGTLQLNGANTYTGYTYINGGTLQFGNGTLTGSSASSLGLVDNATLAFDPGSAGQTVALTISGTGNLVLLGNSVTLSAANTFTGSTTISGGTLQLGNAAALQDSVVSIGVTNGLTFSTGINTFTLGGLAGSSNEVLTNVTTLNVGNNNNTGMNYSGVLSGAASLTKIGTGTQTLSGANMYSGGTTTVSAGTLNLAFGTTTSNILPSGTALAMNGGTLSLTNTASSAVSQTVASLSASAPSTISITPNGSNVSTLTITSNTPTLTGSGAVNFVIPTNAVVAWAPTLNSGGLIGANYTVTDSTGTGFATVSGGDVVRYTAGTELTSSNATSSTGTTNFTTNPAGAGSANYATASTLTLAAASSPAVNSLSIDPGATAGTGYTLNLNSNTLTVTSGGLLMTDAGNYTISGGTLGA